MKRPAQYQMDLTQGPLGWQILRFTLPLIFSSILQVLFHSADQIVIGRFASSTALAAVGSCGSFCNLLVGSFMGLAIGVNVLTARFIGAKDSARQSQCVHTALMLAGVAGILIAVIGFCIARPILTLLETPAEALDGAVLYVRIYCGGGFFLLLLNVGTAILRSLGDTRRPMYFLLTAGVLNVLLNLFFVLVLHLTVSGVALATVISFAISSGLVLRTLLRLEGGCRVRRNSLRIHTSMLWHILQIGVPAAIHSISFSLANVMMQGAINTFGKDCVAGRAAACSIEAVVYISSGCFHQAVISFTGQNFGAGQWNRVGKSILWCAGYGALFMTILTWGTLWNDTALIRIFSEEPEVIRWGVICLWGMLPFYFLCGLMDGVTGGMRGLGYSTWEMLITLVCTCVYRLVWLWIARQQHWNVPQILAAYPISWALTLTGNGLALIWILRHLKKRVTFP